MNENMRKRNEVLAQTVIKGLESRNILGYYAKDKVTLNEEDQQLFDRLYNLLDEIEDVTEIYHNVKMD